MKFGRLICPCELETMLSVADIERITALPTNGHRFEAYVNFVCPECGMCSQYRFDDIPTQTSERPALERIGLFHADLKCEGKNCATRTVVHSLLDATGREPRKAVVEWRVAHMFCPSNHAVKQPAEVTGTRIT
jgi:predicted RNA-binding Zn-ribbon protein involved in translation (DUF1610 family)